MVRKVARLYGIKGGDDLYILILILLIVGKLDRGAQEARLV